MLHAPPHLSIKLDRDTKEVGKYAIPVPGLVESHSILLSTNRTAASTTCDAASNFWVAPVPGKCVGLFSKVEEACSRWKVASCKDILVDLLIPDICNIQGIRHLRKTKGIAHRGWSVSPTNDLWRNKGHHLADDPLRDCWGSHNTTALP
eukprot:CAMPEP_0197510030 /NCGR_PEP_ID=MMETSP1312-20131121/47609_1 /TAXON_ID=464262 /ORGANISM="Genus nov. species nov., Strain RCC2335" /LENGTH=148 /DNA_ID=CAMNT_0043057953 /DNA_START=502 /DNA_END=948 /DNA_ORIENTATION=+